jgi:lipoprotein-anchoring transpeptidase ErfK/SrfK
VRAAVLAALLLALAAAPTAHATDDRIIPDGVSAGGVDLSLLTVDEATAKLGTDAGLKALLRAPLVLGAAGLPWTLTMSKAKLRFNARKTAERAAQVPTQVADESSEPQGGGQPVGVDVPLALTHSRIAVRLWVARVAKGTWRPPRPARLRMTLRHMLVRDAKIGHRLNKRATARQVNRALTGIVDRRLHQRLLKVKPRRTLRDLRNRYPTVITVDRDNFRLRLFKRLRISKRYGIAIGMAGLETPSGLYRIQNKQVNPAWTKPNSSWVPPDERGDVVPGGDPSNPLKARWMGIANGVGIHGTSEDWSIGTRASHGCIRMHVSDVIDLFDRVPVGTPVLIG